MLFDLGNVMIRFSHEKMFDQVGALCGASGDEASRWFLESPLPGQFERGQVGGGEIHRWIEGMADRRLKREEVKLAISDIFWAVSRMEAIAGHIKQAGLRLVLLSNTCAWHVDFIRERFDVLAPFDDLVLSYEVGAAKPESRIYEVALERIGCVPGECFFVDDKQENIDAACRHGLDAELFTDADAFLQHLAARGLSVGSAPD
ncbi:HAD family hydrolase [Kolteria novifilia]